MLIGYHSLALRARTKKRKLWAGKLWVPKLWAPKLWAGPLTRPLNAHEAPASRHANRVPLTRASCPYKKTEAKIEKRVTPVRLLANSVCPQYLTVEIVTSFLARV